MLVETAADPLGKSLLPRFEVRRRRGTCAGRLVARLSSARVAEHALSTQDTSERCRQLAVETLLLLLERAPAAVLPLLPYTVPVLRERLVHTSAGGHTEPAEVRAQRRLLSARHVSRYR